MSAEAIIQELGTQSARLWQDKLFWVPVRHHSPACAYALQQLLHDIEPDMVLIEGPEDCQPLIEQVQHSDAIPPLAFLTQKGVPEDLYSAYFPLCEYSPEWVAMRTATALGARVKLIDLPYESRKNEDAALDERIQNLMSERFLAHSQYLNKIAEHLHCRDHHESWDKLFEQRSIEELKDWKTFFQDVFAYCALARRGYEEDVLKASGDDEREQRMLFHVVNASKNSTGKIVVITGGFHTPALIENFAAASTALVSKKAGSGKTEIAKADLKVNKSWLIRYSFDQLDSLNGYSAGMPSPSYYQTVWEELQRGESRYLQQTAASKLVEIAHDNRGQNITRMISSAEVKAAVYQAEGLARLRGNNGPGRSEIFDAVQSCFVKDALKHSMSTLADARRVLCGDRLGSIPDSVEQPPLIQEAWQLGKKLGLDFDYTQVKTLELDVYRKPKHKKISRYFHLMSWIGSELAIWQGGPDFIHGHRLGLAREHWRYAWTPQVESLLLRKINDGSSIEQVALKKMKQVECQMESDGVGRSAAVASELLTRACVMGLHKYAHKLSSDMGQIINQDERLASIVACGYQLKALERGRAYLDSQQLNADIPGLIGVCWKNSLHLLPRLADLDENNAEEALAAMKQQHAFSKELEAGEAQAFYWQLLRELLDNHHCSALIRGAALGILFIDGHIPAESFDQYLTRFLAPFQAVDLTVNTLRGLISISRESLWRTGFVLERVNQLIESWPEQHFISVLPSLRLLFTELAPNEVDTIAQKIANIIGVRDSDQLLNSTADLSADELLHLAEVNNLLMNSIEALDLQDWFANERS